MVLSRNIPTHIRREVARHQVEQRKTLVAAHPCSNCGVAAGVECRHDYGCTDADRKPCECGAMIVADGEHGPVCANGHDGLQYVDLLDIIGHAAAKSDDYGSTQHYGRWERDVATPALVRLGYEVLGWKDGERDSFGPLSRLCTVRLAGSEQQLIYA